MELHHLAQPTTALKRLFLGRALEESGSQDELSILQLYRNCSTEERLVVRHMLERFAGKRND